jgi:hypothetical protein
MTHGWDLESTAVTSAMPGMSAATEVKLTMYGSLSFENCGMNQSPSFA